MTRRSPDRGPTTARDASPIRVAYVFPQGDIGGAEVATLRIMGAHDRERVDPTAILIQDGPIAEQLATLGIPLVCASEVPRLRRADERRKARNWITATLGGLGAHLQHSVMAWTHSLAGPAAGAAGIPEVWFRHTPPNPRSGLDWHAGLTRTRCVINNSAFTAAKQRHFNPRGFPSTVIRPPVEVDPDADGAAVRNEVGIGEDTLLATVPGRLQRPKGQDVAARALARAAAGAPDLHLLVVGDAAFGLDADFPDRLRALALELGLTRRIHFLGFQRDMSAVYAASDIVLSPSTLPEGFGLVVAEGLAAGKPVVASRVGALPELIEDGVNGLLVPPGDAEALAEPLGRLAGDSALRDRLAAGARNTRINTAADSARELEALYEGILNG